MKISTILLGAAVIASGAATYLSIKNNSDSLRVAASLLLVLASNSVLRQAYYVALINESEESQDE